ncbi:YciI family protein [Streptomyces sp. NPDC048290]|uniref:YciI family protein n=1 Tax=Streptomyces sp. NPDC048290 TaxID=3155811 RepID=UPI003449C329
MPYYVHTQDRPGVEERLLDLAESHWSYMDHFADRLVLRGPTLTADGEEHTGSVHVVDLAGRAEAERFGHEEPYWRAGLYENITVSRVAVVRARPTKTSAALVTGVWPSQPRDPGHLVDELGDDRIDFLALLVDDEGARTSGVVAAVSALPDTAWAVLRPIADRLAGGGPVPLTARRWQQGGRP